MDRANECKMVNKVFYYILWPILFAAFCVPIGLSGQDSARVIKNEAFKAGERLKYRFYYDAWLTGKITAGIGVLEVKEADSLFNGR